MQDWDDYRVILAVARAGSLRGAAGLLGLTHTTIARRLAALQDRRGILFERTPTGYLPTEQGQAVIDTAERMEQLDLASERAVKARGEAISGSLTVSLPEPIAQFLLLEELVAFTELYPEVDLKVETTARFVDLDRSEADVVLRGVKQPPEHLVGRRLFPAGLTYYANREYLERTPPDKLRWIAPVDDGVWPDWREQSPFPDAPVALRIDDITARHRALVAGLGLGRGACFMADPEPALIRLTDRPPVPQQDIWILTHPDLRGTPRVRVFMAFLAEALLAKRSLVTGARD
ncbi:LysR family transcriptional regulator [Qipengyuania flava]|uniref:LysR family transcriptional regulator n=1 Tax=Qipengyuania flava TaxID=192812 RepID=UPI001C62A05E|nr:LysR family transcriptional regulator [Qipengyuania flava]QYJ07999.1 LysR family transcriptional regulator [Qipengyuania flava]